MKQISDLNINRAVRHVLVKHWIDLGRLSVRSTNGAVYMYGVLQRMPGLQGDLTGKILDSMFYEIHRARGVSRLHTHFENWSNRNGLWRAVGEQAHNAGEGEPTQPLKRRSGVNTFVLKKSSDSGGAT